MSNNVIDLGAGEGGKPLFPEAKLIEPCSENECEQGHKWAPQMVIALCPGCKRPIVAVRMQNCPVCNEPVKRIKYRQDHVGAGGGIVASCLGHQGSGEQVRIELNRHHGGEAEKYWDKVTGRMDYEAVAKERLGESK